MNDLIKVNTMSENMALNKCREILNDRREALAFEKNYVREKGNYVKKIIFRMTL